MASYRRWAEPEGWVKNSAPDRNPFPQLILLNIVLVR